MHASSPAEQHTRPHEADRGVHRDLSAQDPPPARHWPAQLHKVLAQHARLAEGADEDRQGAAAARRQGGRQ